MIECTYCNGTGKKGRVGMTYDCPDCGGTGELTEERAEMLERQYRPRVKR